DAIWRRQAIQKLWAERASMGHTPLTKIELKGFPNVDIFLKNETDTKTRNLKHRFSWALIMWAIIEGKIGRTTTVYESTSGNTGSSEAYMCTLVGVPYIAVVANELEEEKIKQIESFGGHIRKVNVSLRNFYAQTEAEKNSGFFINQFGNADRAEEFHESGGYNRESTNVFHEIIDQLAKNKDQVKKTPDIFVHSAGTGGTISSVGRYVLRYALPTQIVLADSEFSLFYDYVIHNMFTTQPGNHLWVKPGIAGIGYGYDVKPVLFGNTTSLVRNVIDEAVKMPDVATTAAIHVLRKRGFDVGPSTGLNFLVSLYKAHELKDKYSDKDRLTIATIWCDPGAFYRSTYYNETWIESAFQRNGGMKGVECWEKIIEKCIDTGSNFLEEGLSQCTGHEKFAAKA
ncbi:hypothetical protein WR25_24467, partial [Diploscapter pachys]